MKCRRREDVCFNVCKVWWLRTHTHTQSHTKTHRFVRGKGNVAVVAAKGKKTKGNRQTKNYYYIQTIE